MSTNCLLRIFLDDMLGYNHALFASKIFGFGNVKSRQVNEDDHSSGVEREDGAGLLNIWDGDGVETEADSFASGEKASIDPLSNIVSVDITKAERRINSPHKQLICVVNWS